MLVDHPDYDEKPSLQTPSVMLGYTGAISEERQRRPGYQPPVMRGWMLRKLVSRKLTESSELHKVKLLLELIVHVVSQWQEKLFIDIVRVDIFSVQFRRIIIAAEIWKIAIS